MKKFSNITLIAALLALLTLAACQKSAEGGSESEQAAETAAPAATNPVMEPQAQAGEPPFAIADSSKIISTPSGLKYYIVQQGTGNKPKPGQKVTAMYHGLLTDGTKFDSSYDRRQPFEFTVGQGQVISGWDEGFQLFPVGTKAVLIIPPNLGYGPQGSGTIPGNATLVFHVELLNVTG